MTHILDVRAAMATLRPPPSADHHVWAARITACWRASVEAILEVGRLLIAAKEALPHGQFGPMIKSELPFTESTAQRLMTIAADQRLSNPAHVQHLPPSWGTLYELTKLPDDEFEAKISDGTIRPDMMRRDLAPPKAEAPPPALAPAPPAPAAARPEPPPAAEDPQPEATAEPDAQAPLPSGARSIMSSRQEPADSLDYFPTPPWATRALIERVMPRFGHQASFHAQSVWEPACGEGHMAEVLREYFREVTASDIHDYGYGHVADFLGDIVPGNDEWIITNPPFGDGAEAFVLRALEFARVGVAMFFRLQWLETIGRFERVFQPFPPAVIAQFAERVPLHKGRWESAGTTATAYLWIVWLKARAAKTTEFMWIPPGQKDLLTKPDDIERFTTKPVTRKRFVVCDEPLDTSTGEIINPQPAGEQSPVEEPAAVHQPPEHPPQAAPLEVEDIPAFLHRDEQNRAPFMEVSQP
jgi:hypothetical protein